MAEIINGKAVALKIKGEVAERTKALINEKRVSPKLVVVLVGDDPASKTYVRNKELGCAEVGILSKTVRLPSNTTEKELIEQIRALNNARDVHGILLQLPLPKGVNEVKVLNEILPEKDVDGLHPVNMGKLIKGEADGFTPCTPQGIIELILSTGQEISGKEAVVIGRSNIVGKPIALLLLQHNATVTVCHSKTKGLETVSRRGEILVAAIGRAEAIKGEMVKEGAIVIDVGINRVNGKLKGDVEYDSAAERASYITPVPGGVGPMTIAMLLRNTIKAAELLASK
ncbi:bifunctional 5,10-methylene-tetrahydrofolate dehydrogenase/5,10-methylene-tetrahydrofolate cyclohydrolase [candidate division WOR-1 bacterium RIFOXYA12_FULL_52_29]|uniref:Bifunctional protein FolD n=1 Tax=candidate division WOR-1 bacterium RIFOXYC12_FULL_54_18 TaxID=1802584 RepID=A0A1F4T6U4_UNCSA|nr:MAG: bifunctional 5,10-methylene-tetrahydrofolate dehydrogenase/5,10-methylene-tetrahydrofolate cyclohydrolase [candidate division WOR-1 bacterium RIFOXYA2_FULL_51_19]OGC18017.1 MAG: bifunctional 5,10-methylene-tetrahydrofolate dehydrogenase/5,10-methylene-tetrahydrofolate cyclohydrolase [candidate division WOR-1 bacterium RIFOXYA12_FULL_52_29]OGC26873.1 MAG: bifunctional 5,10-methylene-tetrahydrofolate dehydrogenase/5,10-methylene-tetrahydrofolate cyclohydrolase [candidate division WOR-1 bact